MSNNKKQPRIKLTKEMKRTKACGRIHQYKNENIEKSQGFKKNEYKFHICIFNLI